MPIEVIWLNLVQTGNILFKSVQNTLKIIIIFEEINFYWMSRTWQEKLEDFWDHLQENIFRYVIFSVLEGLSYFLFTIDWKIFAGVLGGATAGMFLLELTSPKERDSRNIPGIIAYILLPIAF